jgi:hypothetical protein
MSFQNDRLAIVSHRRARVSCSCADEQQEDECGERASHPHLDIQPTASKDIRTESNIYIFLQVSHQSSDEKSSQNTSHPRRIPGARAIEAF